RLPGAEAPVPLRAIVAPRPARTAPELRVTRLPPVEALATLLAAPRVLGWQAPAVLRAHFLACAHLVHHVPVYAADIPWGPPFDPALAADLLARTGLDTAVTEARA
ncbi:MAG: hypothetical protein ACREL9_01580, partial [Gemmatimonadales bacterium]